MSDFEDRALRDSLQRLAGHADDAGAFAAMQQRVRQAKRRRAVVGASGLAALLIGGLAIVGARNHSSESLTPATDGAAVPSIETSVTAPTTAPTLAAVEPTSSTAPATTLPTTTLPTTTLAPAAPGTPSTAAPETTASLSDTEAATTDQPGSTGPRPGTPPTSPSSSQTFDANHGSVTVALRDGRLSIVGHTAERGYRFSIEHSEATRIRVRFRSGDNRSQIEVTLVGGRMVGTSSEEAGAPNTSAPSNTAPSSTPPPTSAPGTTEPGPPPSTTATTSPAPSTSDDHGGHDGSGSSGSGSGGGDGGGGIDDGSGHG